MPTVSKKSNTADRCRACEEYGRVWVPRAEDLYCGLCGKRLRSVELTLSPTRRVPVSTVAHAEPELLPIATLQTGSGLLRVYVWNTGQLDVARLEVRASPDVLDTSAFVSLMVPTGQCIPVTLSFRPGASMPERLELSVASGAFSNGLQIAPVELPTQMIAQAATEADDAAAPLERAKRDTLSILAAKLYGGMSVVNCDLETTAPEARYVTTNSLFLASGAILPGSRSFEFVIESTRGGAWLELVNGATATWAPDANSPNANFLLQLVSDPRNRQLRVIAIASADYADPPPSEELITGRVLIRLEAPGSPKFELKIQLLRDTPWWRIEPDQHKAAHPLQVAAGFWSRLPISCLPSTSGRNRPPAVDELRAALTNIQLRADFVGVSGISKARFLGLRARYGGTANHASPSAARRYEVLLDLLTDPDSRVPQAVPKVVLWLEASFDGGEVARVSDVVGFQLHLVNSGDAQHFMLVDFGTSATCFTVFQPNDIRPDAQPLFTRGLIDPIDRKASRVHPTQLFRTDDGEAYLWPAASPESGSTADFGSSDRAPDHTEFKPGLGIQSRSDPFGREIPFEQLPIQHPDRHCFEYLRELLLEARAARGNWPLRHAAFTCPTTFGSVRRATFESILRALMPYGLISRPEVLLDEANAGALRDVVAIAYDQGKNDHTSEWIMTMDWGGGTFDIAVLYLGARDSHTKTIPLEPFGTTGIELGGRDVTLAIATSMLHQLRTSKDEMARQLALPDDMRRSIAPTGPDTDARTKERNRRELLKLAEYIKVHAYSDPECDQLWGAKSPFNFSRIPSNYDFELTRAPAPSGPPMLPAPGQVRPDRLDKTAWTPLFAGITITRSEIDQIVTPLIDEALGRAQRLWEMTALAAPKRGLPAPPNAIRRIVLAGSSSCLPILRQRIAKVLQVDRRSLGTESEESMASGRAPESLKTKVVLGAADYLRNRDMQARDFPLHILGIHERVLCPIVTRFRGSLFGTLFDIGSEVSEQGVVFQADDLGRLRELPLWENLDLRLDDRESEIAVAQMLNCKRWSVSRDGEDSELTFGLESCSPKLQISANPPLSFKGGTSGPTSIRLFRQGFQRMISVQWGSPPSAIDSRI